MIDPTCKMCETKLDLPGALLFGIPDGEFCHKYHICVYCASHVMNYITGAEICDMCGDINTCVDGVCKSCQYSMPHDEKAIDAR